MSTDSSPASPRWAPPPLASSASVLIRAAVSSDDVSGSGSSSCSELELEEEPKLDDAAPALVPVARLTNDETESDEAETEEEVIDDVDGDGFAIRVRVPAGGGGEVRRSPSSESSGEESFDEVDGDGFSTGSRVHSRRNLNSANSNAEKDEIFTVNSNLAENMGINGGYLDAAEEKDEILGSGKMKMILLLWHLKILETKANEGSSSLVDSTMESSLPRPYWKNMNKAS